MIRVVVIPGVGMAKGSVLFRAVSVGVAVGIFFGAIAFAESGSWAALVAPIVVGPLIFGIPVARRMAKFWPSATALRGDGSGHRSSGRLDMAKDIGEAPPGARCHRLRHRIARSTPASSSVPVGHSGNRRAFTGSRGDR